MNILCVDDSATLRKIVALTLSGVGHQVSEAENGKAALDSLGSKKPDCIILDINMPVMGGIEFLERRAKDPALRAVPVIVLTTQDEEALRAQAMGLGANGFLGKPFEKEHLLATMRQIVGG